MIDAGASSNRPDHVPRDLDVDAEPVAIFPRSRASLANQICACNTTAHRVRSSLSTSNCSSGRLDHPGSVSEWDV